MPPIEEVDCWDSAVLWPATGGVDKQGQPLLGAPVDLTYPNGVRFLNKVAWAVDPNGNLIQVNATAVVLRDIPIHSQMWFGGKLADWYGTGSNDTMDQLLMTVETFNSTPDTQRRFYRRVVGLMRLHNR